MASTWRRGPGRGSRMGKGVLSGSTLAVVPSGVTIDKQGIEYSAGTFITPTEIGYLDGQAGYGVAYTTAAGYRVAYGLTDVANSGVSQGTGSVSSILEVATGLTTVLGFWGSVYDATSDMHKSSVSIYLDWQKNATYTSRVTVVTAVEAAAAGTGGATPYNLFNTGVSLSWLAFGT